MQHAPLHWKGGQFTRTINQNLDNDLIGAVGSNRTHKMEPLAKMQAENYPTQLALCTQCTLQYTLCAVGGHHHCSDHATVHWSLTSEAPKQRIKTYAFSVAFVFFTQPQRPCSTNRTETASEHPRIQCQNTPTQAKQSGDVKKRSRTLASCLQPMSAD